MFADHATGFVPRPVVEIFLELAFDDAALFLDHQHFFRVGNKGQRITPRQGPDHADFVDIDAKTAAGGFVQPQQTQRLHQIQMALAGGDDAKGGIVQIIDTPVDRVGLDKGFDGAELMLQPGLDFGAWHVRAAHMQPAGRWRDLGERKRAVRLQRHRLPAFHRLGNRFEPDPCAGKTA